MADKLVNIIDRSLNTRITPLAYLIALHSLAFGGSFAFFSSSPSVQATLLYQNGALVGIPVWGWMAFSSATLLIVAMAFKLASLIQASAAVLFMCWLFATITYAQNSQWLQMVLAVILVLCFGYHFLATSLGRLWDYTPKD